MTLNANLVRQGPQAPVAQLSDWFAEGVTLSTKSLFITRKHSPSDRILADLRAIPETAKTIIEGRYDKLNPPMYVSTLDVGCGKSTVIGAMCQELWFGEVFGGPAVGVLIALSRLEQIEDFITSNQLEDEQYAVIANRDAKASTGQPFIEMGLGAENADEARILICTQAHIYHHLRRTDWANAKRLYFQGQPRPLRLWDESIELRKEYGLDKRIIRSAINIRGIPQELERYGDAVIALVNGAKPGDTIQLPAIEKPVEYLWLLEQLEDRADEAALAALETLVRLTRASEARLREDNNSNRVLLSFEVGLPSDTLPIIVLDAGSQHKAAYQSLPEAKVWLPSTPKRHDNVQLNAMYGKDGRGWFWKQRGYLTRLKEAADIIKANPDRLPMILCHKEPKRFEGEIKRVLTEHLGANASKVHVVTYGSHNASNAHSYCDLVICCTLFRKPGHAYEALAHAVENRPMNQDPNWPLVKKIEDTEVVAETVQGLGRSCIRLLDGEQAQAATIYLWTSNEAIPLSLQGRLSGLKSEWLNKPMKKGQPMRSRADDVLKFLTSWKANRKGVTVYYDEIYKPLKINQSDFSKLLNKDTMKKALAANGWAIHRSRPSYLKRSV